MAAAPDDRIPTDALHPDSSLDDDPSALYTGDGDIPLYDDNVSGGSGLEAYRQAVETYLNGSDEGYGAGPVTAATPTIQQYVDTMADYDNKVVTIDTDTGAYVLKDAYDTDEPKPVEHVDEDAFAAYKDVMEAYGLDPEDGWRPADESYGLDEVAALLDGDADAVDGVDAVGEDEYVTAVDAAEIDGPEIYNRYLEDDEDESSYLEIAVVEQEMPDGLFGFTRPGQENVVFVNKALYKVDKEKTTLHEITHQEHPHWSEFMVRSRRTRGGGDIDPQYTMSFQANNPGRMGTGSGRVRPYNALNHTNRQYM